jgi:hypothetical protein
MAPGDDDSLNGVETPKKFRCAFHVTLDDSLANYGAGANFAIKHHRRDSDEPASVVAKHPGHHFRVAGAAFAEMEILAHDDHLRVQAANKNLAYKGLSRQSLKTSRKILKDDGINPGLPGILDTLVVRRQETLNAPSRQLRVVSEGVDDGSKTFLVAAVDKFLENPLMTNVETVEGS